MSRETENALLLLLGLSTAIITVTGVYTRYVKPSLLPWLAAVAVLLVPIRDDFALGVDDVMLSRRDGIPFPVASAVVARRPGAGGA